MKRKIWQCVVVAAMACVIGIDGTSAEDNMECKIARNRQIVEELKLGSALDDAVDYLMGRNIPYTIFSRKGQEISQSEIRSRDYETIQPVEIVIVSDSPRRSFMIIKSEVLTLIFAEGRRLFSASCKEFVTGP
jgi:hypothetical protein